MESLDRNYTEQNDRKYLNQEQFDELYPLAVRIGAMLQKLIEYLQKTEVKGVRKK